MPSFIGNIKFPRIEPLALRMADDYSNAWSQIYPESSPAPAAQPQIYDQVFTQPVPTYNQPRSRPPGPLRGGPSSAGRSGGPEKI